MKKKNQNQKPQIDDITKKFRFVNTVYNSALAYTAPDGYTFTVVNSNGWLSRKTMEEMLIEMIENKGYAAM